MGFGKVWVGRSPVAEAMGDTLRASLLRWHATRSLARRVVEVAGVEPASLKVSGVASTCVVVYLISGEIREATRLSVPSVQ